MHWTCFSVLLLSHSSSLCHFLSGQLCKTSRFFIFSAVGQFSRDGRNLTDVLYLTSLLDSGNFSSDVCNSSKLLHKSTYLQMTFKGQNDIDKWGVSFYILWSIDIARNITLIRVKSGRERQCEKRAENELSQDVFIKQSNTQKNIAKCWVTLTTEWNQLKKWKNPQCIICRSTAADWEMILYKEIFFNVREASGVDTIRGEHTGRPWDIPEDSPLPRISKRSLALSFWFDWH